MIAENPQKQNHYLLLNTDFLVCFPLSHICSSVKFHLSLSASVFGGLIDGVFEECVCSLLSVWEGHICVCVGGDQLLLDVSSVLGSGDDNKAKHSDE